MTTRTSLSSERGTALLIVLLMLTLAVGLIGGFITTLVTDQQLRGVDQSRTRVFYAAHGALEQLTADLGNVFASNFAPTSADITALTATEPVFNRVVFDDPGGGTGYEIDFPVDASGAPDTEVRSILSGPFQGFTGMVTPYSLAVTARSAEETSLSSEVRLERTLQTVAIPLFQFGIFSETDLSYFPGANFNFGGRVHTNGNLFMAVTDGNALNIRDRVTAVREVIRTNLSNGHANTTGYNGTVSVARAPNQLRVLGMNEGSLVGSVGTAQREPGWTNMSIGDYNGYLRNGRTGARRLDLPFTTLGATPIDLIRRGTAVDHPLVLAQRIYQLASMRILLSDQATDLTGLPGVVGTPLTLEAGPLYGGRRVAESGSGGDNRTTAGTSRLGGWIVIEIQRADQTWQDVTAEVLGLGITGPGPGCATTPNPNAIIRLQRIANGASCITATETDFWPHTLYDTREANLRDVSPGGTGITLSGVMHYVELDVNNLRLWLNPVDPASPYAGLGAVSGANARSVNGYTVYFSDRRTNNCAAAPGGCNAVNQAEFGFEDFVNPATGTPNSTLDAGEDVNANNTVETYGATPVLFNSTWSPNPTLTNNTVSAGVAQSNRAVFFRRALKLVNGTQGNLPMPGFTLVAENPVYVQGNYNADAAGFNDNLNAAAAVIADAVTLLSGNWNDNTSFANPNLPGNRPAQTTWYRMAILSGKGPAFPFPGGPMRDFGTDGGVHNFLRYLENWGGQTLNYRGSIASLYFNRQAVGLYKCCTTVYGPPTRGYGFDVEFLQPALLPPFTPMFRDVNTTGFTQVIR